MLGESGVVVDARRPARQGACTRGDGVGKERLQAIRGCTRAISGWTRAGTTHSRSTPALTKKILDNDGPSGLVFDCFDHGGAGGGFENTWGTGKLMFTAMKTPMVRIHNRPAYNSECHATRDMGIGELNNSYEDAEVAESSWRSAATPYETQTNYFLAHWLPNLQGGTLDKKKKWFPGEPSGRPRIIIVDPRRTPTVAIAESIAGKENVLHLDIEPGTDIALFNGLFTYVVEQGWHDKDFIAKYTKDFDAAVQANKLSLDEASRITGVPVAKLKQAADWAYKPKAAAIARIRCTPTRRASSGATTTI